MSLDPTNRPAVILLVEDNPGDARLAEEAINEGNVPVSLHHVEDGVEAMKFFRQEAPHENAPRPDLVLLDLNLPKKSGQEVLAEVKADPELRRIPISILSTSDAAIDIKQAYNNHCNCYITKPVDLDQFIEVVGYIERFWLTIAKLPAE